MRGPNFILSSNAHRRHSFLKYGTVDPFVSLSWAVFKLSSGQPYHPSSVVSVVNFKSEKGPGIHLVAIRASGHAHIYTVERDELTYQFQLTPEPTSVEAAPQCFPYGSYVLDPTTGLECVASRSRFSDLAQGESAGLDVYWVTAGKKGLKCSRNADGNRLGRVEFGSKNGAVESARVVHKHSMRSTEYLEPPKLMSPSESCVVGAFTDKGKLLVYSIPRLEHMYTVPVTISSPRFVKKRLRLLLAYRLPDAVGYLVSMKAETTSIGRPRTMLFINASLAHCLGCEGSRYIMTRFSTSFETRKNFPRNRGPCQWGQQLCSGKCTRTSVDKALQGHRSIFFVSTYSLQFPP